jgi:hypothetical protein
MAFNQALMDDLCVVPTISLNPKKAKKKLKKAARMSDDLEVTQLPVYQDVKEEVSLSPTKETQRASGAKSVPKTKCQVRSAPAPKPVEEPAFFKPAPTLLAKQAAQPQRCAVQALATPRNTKRSWFDITEEDEDDFIGLSFTQYSTPGVTA